MSIFASRITETIELPFDPPHTVVIRKLPGRHLERAQREHLIQSVETIKQMGGPAFQRELAASADAPTTTAAPDPLVGYDRFVLLTKGIASWSYPEPVTADQIEDLDAEAADFLARAILKLTKPALFQTDDEAEAAAKNA